MSQVPVARCGQCPLAGLHGGIARHPSHSSIVDRTACVQLAPIAGLIRGPSRLWAASSRILQNRTGRVMATTALTSDLHLPAIELAIMRFRFRSRRQTPTLRRTDHGSAAALAGRPIVEPIVPRPCSFRPVANNRTHNVHADPISEGH